LSSSLPVDLLILRLVGSGKRERDDASSPQWSSLLPLLDPTSVHIDGEDLDPSTRLPGTIDLRSAPWPNLVHIYITEAASYKAIGESLFARSPGPPMTVVFLLPSTWDWDDVCNTRRDGEITEQLGPGNLTHGWFEGWLKEVVVEVELKRDAEVLEETIWFFWELVGRADEWREHRRSGRVRFDVVDFEYMDDQDEGEDEDEGGL